MKGDIPLLPKFYGQTGNGAALAAFWIAINWRWRDKAMELAREMTLPSSRSSLVKTARERNRMMLAQMREFRKAMAELKRENDDLVHQLRMPDGARRSQCPACGWTFGTHAPDCEVKS